ncbi:MAG: hypothetical protein R3C05_14625 [Pirellulaceae bacterium]
MHPAFVARAASVNITFENARPTVIADSVNGLENSPITLSAAVTDPGVADTQSYTIDWGDGSLTAGTAKVSAATAFNFDAATADDGSPNTWEGGPLTPPR